MHKYIYLTIIFSLAIQIAAFRFCAPQKNKMRETITKRLVSFMLNPLHNGEETVDIEVLKRLLHS